MLVVYLLLFLHLSASTCGATSRNQHLFLHGAAADVSATSPAIHGHRHAAKDLSYYHVHYHPAMTLARRGGPPPRPSPGVEASGGVQGAPPPPPSLPGVEASGVVAGGAPPPSEKEAGAAVQPSPSPPPEVNDGGGEQEEENATDDVGVDYAGPKTHPPSHN
ncbi:unnamed protein product [Urochloa decumbens]|uniref:Uncharacterized protein n=1 Tax=Urochloa decumbens TaxID=240449 RepID=A0ABC9BMM1_9POAL